MPKWQPAGEGRVWDPSLRPVAGPRIGRRPEARPALVGEPALGVQRLSTRNLADTGGLCNRHSLHVDVLST